MHDRDYYRACSPDVLLKQAQEQGINPEMAIVLAEALAYASGYRNRLQGKFAFNKEHVS